MGLLSKLFGKKEKTDSAREGILAKVKETTAKPMNCEGCYVRLEECFPDANDFDLKLDVVNMLYEMDRDDWAETLALKISHDEQCPLNILVGFVKHFNAANETQKVVEPTARYINERPSDTDMAIKLGRYLLGQKEYERCLDDLERAFESSPESIALYGIFGEAFLRLKQWEDAVNHLRTACELYEEAFRLHQIAPDDLHNEQLEYSRLYAMLEDAAIHHYGPEGKDEAFENIEMEPSGFGLEKEAEHLAVSRVEYKPRRLSIAPLDELEAQSKELVGDEFLLAESKFLLGSKALRENNISAAMQAFRAALELDIESYGAYFGWAACNILERFEPLPDESAVIPWSEEETAQLAKVCPMWEALTRSEQRAVRGAFEPVRGFLPRLVEAGAKNCVHPLDVRLTDLYPERVEIRFEPDGRPPQALPAFAAKLSTHTRVDEFLKVSAQQFTFARQVGYLVHDTVEALDAEKFKQLQQLVRDVRAKLPAVQTHHLANASELMAAACESAALLGIFGDEAKSEFAEHWENHGVFAFVRELK